MTRVAVIGSLALALVALAAGPATATKCTPRHIHYVARCAAGTCDAGFIVQEENLGARCESIPRIYDVDRAELAQALALAWSTIPAEKQSGVLQWTTHLSCRRPLADGVDHDIVDACVKEGKSVLLSPDPANLAAARADWERVSADTARRDRVRQITESAMFALIVLLALAVPWWVHRRGASPYWLAIPVLLQLPLTGFILLHIMFMHRGTGLLGLLTALILAVMTVVELVWIIRHAGKGRALRT